MMSEKKHILVIDDSVSIRNFIKGILEEAGYKVYEAKDGQEGLGLYKEYNDIIDLVVTDIYMPNKGGLEFVVDVKKENKDLKIIVLSDGGKNNFSNELNICEALGATYFIKKDLIKEKLVDLVNEVI